MWYIYKMEYYAAIRKKKILQFVTTQMDFEGIMLSEITETQKDKYQILYDLTYMQNLKKGNTRKQNRVVVARGRG